MTPTIIYCRTHKNITAAVIDVQGKYYFQVYAVNPENNRTGLKTSQPGDHKWCVEQFNKCSLDQMAYDDWMSQVNAHLSNKTCGLTSMDLPDYDYRIAYDNELVPAEVAEDVVEFTKRF